MRKQEFDTWYEARAAAQVWANELGMSVGIEKPVILKGMARPYQGWTIKILPRKANRYGWETRCEVVDPC